MQSSPPNRPWKAAGSPAGSQYSINLAALDLDARSDDSGDIPKPKVDRIFSEDIDGPSDFTQNMEHWLRGGTSAKGTLRSIRGPVETITEAQEVVGDSEDHRPLLDETHDENYEGPEKNDARSSSNHTPMGTPPRISISQRSNADGHFSSVWEPYGITSTPFPREQNGLLQPTVEDYHSELTPARPTPQRSPAGAAAVSEHDDDPIADSPSKILESSPLLSKQGSVLRPTTIEIEEDSREREALIVKPWQVKCDQLQRFNDAVQEALDEERRLRNADSLEREAEIAEADRQARHHAELHKKLQLEIEVLRRERDEAQAALSAERSKLNVVDGDQTVQVQQLKGELEHQVEAHATELASMRTALETAQNAQREAEATVQRHQSEIDSLNDLHNAEMGRLRLEVQNAKQDESTISSLEKQLQIAHAEIERLRASLAASHTDLGNLQTQLNAAQTSLSEETSRYTSERTRAIDLAAELQRQMQDLRQQLRTAQAAQDADIARLHLPSEDDLVEQPTTPSSPQELATLRATHDAQTTALNEAVLDRDEAQDALEQSRTALAAAEAALADAAAVNAALDARVAETLRAREQSWRERWAAAERERRVMAKALLHQWGREEVGRAVDGEAQMYAYKYLVRAGKGEEAEGAGEAEPQPRRCKTCQRRPSRSRSTLVSA